MDIVKLAREKYRPIEPRIIFIAEAPPENIERFFYYEDVKTGDTLFINLMRVLYPEYRKENNGKIEDIRRDKAKLLKRFQADGYYLIDALPGPISLRLSSSERVKLIDKRKFKILAEISKLLGDKPLESTVASKGVILIKVTVFDALEQHLHNYYQSFLLNSHTKVPFPSHGHNKVFASALHKILSRSDSRYRLDTRFGWYEGDLVIDHENKVQK